MTITKRWGEFSGIGKVTPQDLRRTAITRALDLGHTYRQVQNGSGHKHIQSVQRYDHHRQNLEDNLINTLNYDENTVSETSAFVFSTYALIVSGRYFRLVGEA